MVRIHPASQFGKLKKGWERRERRPRFQRARKRQNSGRRKENADKELKRKNAKNFNEPCIA